MNTELKIDNNTKIPCTIILPTSEIDSDKYNKFLRTLMDSDFLIRITKKNRITMDFVF